MRINIKATNLELTDSIRVWIEKKLDFLGRFLKNLETKYPIEVWVEIAKMSHHKKGEVFYAEVQFTLPDNNSIRVEIYENDLRKAIVQAKRKIKERLERYKTKTIDKKRKKQRKGKAIIKEG